MSEVLLRGLILGGSAMVVLLILRFILTRVIKIVREHERGVIFRLGRIQGGPRGQGQYFLVPFVDRMAKVDLTTITMDVPTQEVRTRGNVPLRVNAVIYFRVVDPIKSVIEVENYVPPTGQISLTTLESVYGQRVLAHTRTALISVLGQRDFEDLLTNRETKDEELRRIIDEQTEPWGIEVSKVIIKDVEFPEEVKRDMARRAESERERRRA